MIQIVEPCVRRYQEPNPLAKIEYAARICKGTEDRVDPKNPNTKLIKTLLSMKPAHESVTEHYRICVEFECAPDTPFNDTTTFMLWSLNPGYLELAAPITTTTENGSITTIPLVGNIRAFRDLCRYMHDCDFGLSQLTFTGSDEYECARKTKTAAAALFAALCKWQPVLFEDLLTEGETLDEYHLNRIHISEATDYFTFVIDTDRNVTHQLVRHREECSYSQQSQRFCRYKDGVKFTRPVGFDWAIEGNKQYSRWQKNMQEAENNYLDMLGEEMAPEEARLWLPGSCHTKIMVTFTAKALEHFMELRLPKNAYAPIRYIANEILKQITRIPLARCVEENGDMVNGFQVSEEVLQQLAGIVQDATKD